MVYKIVEYKVLIVLNNNLNMILLIKKAEFYLQIHEMVHNVKVKLQRRNFLTQLKPLRLGKLQGLMDTSGSIPNFFYIYSEDHY